MNPDPDMDPDQDPPLFGFDLQEANLKLKKKDFLLFTFCFKVHLHNISWIKVKKK
jgi:hypothetical protein